MRSFLRLLLLLSVTSGLGACARAANIASAVHGSLIAAKSKVLPSSRKKTEALATHPRYAAHTATLDVTFGLKVAGVIPLPEDFAPDMSRAPLWLLGGSEIALLGTRGGKSVMLGFSGAGVSQQRVVLEDYGAGAAGGQLLDVALSPDGHTLAAAVATAPGGRLEVNLADAASPGDAHSIASLEGDFDSAQLNWLGAAEIALAVHAVAPAAELSSETTPIPVSGLYVITAGEPAFTRRLKGIDCPLSPLAFSANSGVAVAQGGAGAPPALIDLHKGTCTGFPTFGPLQVLGWAPDSEAFLYRAVAQPGVFRFDLRTGRSSTIAISSGAAAYALDGTIIALGSQTLSWRRAVAEPLSPVKAQIALIDPHQDLITINSIGFATQPALLAQSTMVFSPASNDAIIDTAIPSPTGPLREIIEYSYPARAAFVLAHGAVRGPIAISWSPDGKLIAIVDGDAAHRTLAVIAPPK
jgi:hypothetical protein